MLVCVRGSKTCLTVWTIIGTWIMHSVVACHSVYVPLRQLFQRTHARTVVIMHTTQNNYRKRESSCAPFAFSTLISNFGNFCQTIRRWVVWKCSFSSAIIIFPRLYRSTLALKNRVTRWKIISGAINIPYNVINIKLHS